MEMAECRWTGPNQTDRGKKGSKRHILVDGHGVPLVADHYRCDSTDISQLASAVLDAIIVSLPRGGMQSEVVNT